MSELIHQARAEAGFYDVPCNGCRLCCQNDAVRILPHEDETRWQTEPHPYMPGARMLAHKANNDCVYLGEHGCTIQDAKPQQCREMDCRRIAQAITWTQARKMDARGALRMALWKRGRELARLSGSNER